MVLKPQHVNPAKKYDICANFGIIPFRICDAAMQVFLPYRGYAMQVFLPYRECAMLRCRFFYPIEDMRCRYSVMIMMWGYDSNICDIAYAVDAAYDKSFEISAEIV